MQVTGTIKRISATEQVSDKFKKRDFVISTKDVYPQLVQFQTCQDKVSLLDKFKPGQEITVHFNLRGKEYNDKNGETKYFNTLDCWKIEGVADISYPSDSYHPKDDFVNDPF